MKQRSRKKNSKKTKMDWIRSIFAISANYCFTKFLNFQVLVKNLVCLLFSLGLLNFTKTDFNVWDFKLFHMIYSYGLLLDKSYSFTITLKFQGTQLLRSCRSSRELFFIFHVSFYFHVSQVTENLFNSKFQSIVIGLLRIRSGWLIYDY